MRIQVSWWVEWYYLRLTRRSPVCMCPNEVLKLAHLETFSTNHIVPSWLPGDVGGNVISTTSPLCLPQIVPNEPVRHCSARVWLESVFSACGSIRCHQEATRVLIRHQSHLPVLQKTIPVVYTPVIYWDVVHTLSMTRDQARAAGMNRQSLNNFVPKSFHWTAVAKVWR